MHLTKRSYLLVGAAVLLAVALGFSATVYAARPVSITIPERTPIHVALDQTLASNKNKAGDHFQATVTEPVVVDGQTAIAKGTHVEGLVVDARKSGRLKGKADLRLALRDVQVNGQTYHLRTTSAARVGAGHKKRNFLWIGGGAGGGALIGALAAGGEGALIGGPVGAGAGTAVAFLTGKRDVKYPAETHLTFRLAEPVTLNGNNG